MIDPQKIAVVNEYLVNEFPNCSIKNHYNFDRMGTKGTFSTFKLN